jgi:hypothetical protein
MQQHTLVLDPSERRFLAYVLAPDERWPAAGDDGYGLYGLPEAAEIAGGPRFRALVLAMYVQGNDDNMPVPVTVSELWLLDSLLVRHDLRREKLPDGRPLTDLAHKVWDLLLDAYADELPPHLQKETSHADNDTNQASDANAFVAEAEAILRSRDGSRASDDLPPTAS